MHTENAPDTHAAEDRLAVPVKMGWAAGSLGTVTLLYLVNNFFLFFATTQLGVAAGVAGAILLVSRLYDAVSDPLMGIISDRFTTRWGRRRPWLLAGALICPLGCILIFASPAFENSWWTVAYLTFALLIYFSGYSAFNVPYLAMPTEMTDSPLERTSIMAYRVFFVGLAGLAATAIAPALIQFFGEGRAGFQGMANMMALLIMAAMLTTFFASKNLRATPSTKNRLAPRAWIATIIDNKPLLYVLIAKLLQLFGLASSSAMLFFFVTQVMQRGAIGVALFGGVTTAANLLTLPIWVRLNRRLGKPMLYASGVGIFVIAQSSWLLSGPDEPTWIYVLRAIGVGIGAGGLILMGQSLLPDVIAEDYRRTGMRREAALAAVYSTVEKFAFAISPFIIGTLLSFSGFIESRGQPVAQPDSAIFAVYVTIAVIPPLAYLASVPFILKITLARPSPSTVARNG
jgi:GPH family glycoside/pentoside/hexuronide:cation symporter